MSSERRTTVEILCIDDEHCDECCQFFNVEGGEEMETFCGLFLQPITNEERCEECKEGEVKE